MSKAHRRRKRSIRDIERHWDSRFAAFTKAGFTDKEATWAANQGLSPRNKEVRKKIIARRGRVEGAMEEWGWSREKAIEKYADDLRSKLDGEGIDESNIFYETS